jgi:hypothetical protein
MTMSDVSVIPVCTYARARDVDMQTSVTSDMVTPLISQEAHKPHQLFFVQDHILDMNRKPSRFDY